MIERKQKLTYILHDIAIGGVEVALLSAIPKLNAEYDLRIIVLGKINPKMIAHLSEEEQSVFKALSYKLPLYPFKLPGIIREVLRNEPDIIVSSLWRGTLVGTLAKLFRKNIKFFAFVHNTGFPHKLAELSNKRATKLADAVLTDSQATKEYVEENFRPGAQVSVVSFLTNKAPRELHIQPPDVTEEVKFLFLGRINRVKNLSAAIELIQYLRSKSINATLDIYGRSDDDSIEELKQQIEGAELQSAVAFKGEVTGPEKFKLFKYYHFYLQLSHNEGMAMSVAEAMQNGLVCVVSPVGEIVNYSADMESAIFIDITTPQSQIQSFSKVYNAISDSGLYSQLAKTSFDNFSKKALYADSLVKELRRG